MNALQIKYNYFLFIQFNWVARYTTEFRNDGFCGKTQMFWISDSLIDISSVLPNTNTNINSQQNKKSSVA